MEILGKVKAVLPLQSGTSQRGPWSRATVVIEYKSGNYFNTLALDNMSKAEEFSKLTVGGFYTFYFEPSSREYQGRYYTQCTCLRLRLQHLRTCLQHGRKEKGWPKATPILFRYR